MAVNGPISGKWIALKIGGVTPVLVPGVQSWSGRVVADQLDATTAEDGGYDNPDDGVKGCTIQAKIVMDINDGEYTPLKVGTLIADFKGYADISAAVPIIHMPLCKVFESEFGGEIKGTVTYNVTIKSKGEFTEADPN